MVWAEVDELGTYCIIDLGKWLNELDKVTENEDFYVEESDTDNSLMLLNSEVKAESTVETARTLIINGTSIADNYMKYTFNGNTYSIIENKMTWPNAKLYCEKLGGHLVTISSKEENDFVQETLKRNNLNNYTAIGYSDIEKEGVWKWVTGENSSYTNWDLRWPEPNNGIGMGEQDYAFMISNGTWDDGFSGSTAIFICEWEKQYEPTFDYISSTGLSGLTLKAPLKKGSKVNSDSDTLTDSDEINWELIVEGKLPTLGELMDSKEQKGYVVAGLSRMSSLYQAASRCKSILPILSDPTKADGDEDGIWDNEDPNKLRKDTLETLYASKISKKNNINNSIYVKIEENTVYISANVYIVNKTMDRYTKLALEGIKDRWEQNIVGSSYDFLPGLKGNVVVTLNQVDYEEIENGEKYPVYIRINETGIPHNLNTVLWSMEKSNFFVNVSTKDPRNKKSYSSDQFKGMVAHEFGHSLGLYDAYPDANKELGVNKGKYLISNAEIGEGTKFCIDGSIMWNSGIAYSNDIEMVLQAFIDNELQFYMNIGPHKKSKAIRLPQNFRE